MRSFKDKLHIIGIIAALALASFASWKYSSYQTASIITPLGGETYQLDKPVEIRWMSGNPGIRKIELIPQTYVPIVLHEVSVFGYPVYDTSGYFSFIPSAKGVPAGEYYVKIYSAVSGEYSETKSPIRIVSPQPPAVPVAVTSPNGGETYTLGSPIKISWSGGKNKVWVGIAKAEYTPGGTYPLMAFITKDAAPNGSLVWDGKLCVLPTDCRPVTYWEPSGFVKAVVVSENSEGFYCTYSPDMPCNIDASDGPFTVKAAVVAPPPPLVAPQPTTITPIPSPVQPKPTVVPSPPVKSKPVLPVSPDIKREISAPPQISDDEPLPGEPDLPDVKPPERKSFLGRVWGIFRSWFGY